MPSPVLHTLAAVLIAKPSSRAASHRDKTILIGSAVIAANVPDLDFVPGILLGDPGKYHHGSSHSLLAAILFGLAAGLIAHFARYPAAARLGVVASLAYVTHLLLDAAAPLDDAGRGVPFFWPLSAHHFVSPVRLFMGIGLEPSRGSLLASLLTPHNILAFGLEIAVVLAVVGVVRILRK
jgi:inner membrane protein